MGMCSLRSLGVLPLLDSKICLSQALLYLLFPKSFRSYNAKQTWAEIKAYICTMCVMGTIHGRTIGSDIQVCRAFAAWFRTLICPDRKFFLGKLEPEKTSEFRLTQLQSFPATCISLFFFSTSGLCVKMWECISLTHWSQELCQADCQ